MLLWGIHKVWFLNVNQLPFMIHRAVVPLSGSIQRDFFPKNMTVRETEREKKNKERVGELNICIEGIFYQ